MSLVNRVDQLSRIRELTREAEVVNMATGETHRGSSAVYMLTQGRHSFSRRGGASSSSFAFTTNKSHPPLGSSSDATNINNVDDGTNGEDQQQVYLDMSTMSDCKRLRLSLTNRRPPSATRGSDVGVPSAVVSAGELSSASPQLRPQSSAAENVQSPAESVTAILEAAEEVAPFPTKIILRIILTQVMTQSPVIVFAALTPYLYSELVGDYQKAGTVSSAISGASMLIQVFLTPILSQLMDMYGRRKLAIVSAMKAVVTVAPLFVAGAIVGSSTQTLPSSSDDGGDKDSAKQQAMSLKLGGYMTGDLKTVVHLCFVLFWALKTVAGMTTTSETIVAISDVCQNQRTKAAAIGMYTGASYLLAVAAIVGATASLFGAACIAMLLALAAVAVAVFWMPETVALRSKAAPHLSLEKAMDERRPLDLSNELPTIVASPVPSTAESEVAPHTIIVERTAATSADSRRPTTALPQHTLQYDYTRRIDIWVNPMKGFRLIAKSRASMVALSVLVCFLLAEISASDTLVYYLAITLDFGPSDTSYLQMEGAAIAMLSAGLLGPFLARRVSCHHLCMVCGVFVATALIVLATASSTTVVFAVYTPLSSLASLMMPALASISTKDASSPEEVSLSMGTVIAMVTLIQSAASFLVAIVFNSLGRDELWITFVVSACFTVPMFGLSVYLGHVCRKEDEEDAARKQATQENATSPDTQLK